MKFYFDLIEIFLYYEERFLYTSDLVLNYISSNPKPNGNTYLPNCNLIDHLVINQDIDDKFRLTNDVEIFLFNTIIMHL